MPIDPQPLTDSFGLPVFSHRGEKKPMMEVIVAGQKMRECSVRCVPPYRPGDVICIKESWNRMITSGGELLVYKADFTEEQQDGFTKKGIKWNSPSSMPDDMARLSFRVESVRVERFSSVSISDIYKEGIWGDASVQEALRNKKRSGKADILAWRDYCYRWNSNLMNSQKESLSVNADPWTWAITLSPLLSE